MSQIEELPSSDIEEVTYDSKAGDVYLAYVDTPVKENDEITFEDTFIGGEPIWLHPDSVPSKDLLTCGACKSSENMRLLLQAFSPLDDLQMNDIQLKFGMEPNLNFINGQDDRVLYVFMCTKCQRKGNSVRCIRGVRRNPDTDVSHVNEKIDNLSEGKRFQINPFDIKDINNNTNDTSSNVFQTDSSNPFGANPFQTNSDFSGNPFASGVISSTVVDKSDEKPKSQEPSIKQQRKLHDAQKDKSFDNSKSFKSYLLYVEEERFTKKPDHLKLPKNIKIDKEALELTGNTEDDLEKDPIKSDPRTEKLSQFLDDDTFQKFQEIVGYNPAQILRYDIGGKPLYYAKTIKAFEDTVSNPNYNPQSRRIFEMQLMPKMILDLEETVSVETGMEWGSIFVFTDIENYIPKFDENGVGYVEECVKVQWESKA